MTLSIKHCKIAYTLQHYLRCIYFMSIALTDDIALYLAQVKKIPKISAEEERECFKRYNETGCLTSMHRIITAHLRYVVYLSKQYQNGRVSLSDLIQEGNVGLMQAAKSFNVETPVRFISYAVHYVKNQILEHLSKFNHLVKFNTTNDRRKLCHNYDTVSKTVGNSDAIKQLSAVLNVSESEINEFHKWSYFNTGNYSTHSHLDASGENDNISHTTFDIADDRPSISESVSEQQKRQLNLIYEGMKSLDDRHYDIIYSRYIVHPPIPLRELASKYQVSIERISQLERNAMAKLKGLLHDN